MSAEACSAKQIARELQGRSQAAVRKRRNFLGVRRAWKIAPRPTPTKYRGAVKSEWMIIMRAHAGAVKAWKAAKAKYGLNGNGFVL